MVWPVNSPTAVLSFGRLCLKFVCSCQMIPHFFSDDELGNILVLYLGGYYGFCTVKSSM